MSGRMGFLADPTWTPAPVERARPRVATVDDMVGLLESFGQRGECCAACGCLCLPDEVCPGCRARRLS